MQSAVVNSPLEQMKTTTAAHRRSRAKERRNGAEEIDACKEFYCHSVAAFSVVHFSIEAFAFILRKTKKMLARL